MARKDDIFNSFLEHELLKSKYELIDSELPKTVLEATKSPIPIIKAIALIVNDLESPNPSTDNSLRNVITQYLNTVAI